MNNVDEMKARQALRAAYAKFSRDEIARELDTDQKTLDRWDDGAIPKPRRLWHALQDILQQEIDCVEPNQAEDFTFIDLFAGIGGTRLGFQRAGGKCVFTSEYDRFCVQTYRANFRPDHEIVGDIRQVTKSEGQIDGMIPDHDVLVAGFPCQPFSIAGVSKKNALGDPHGFECKTQGTLFFDVCKILQTKRPLAFLLENVRNLKSHDKGRTFRVIMDSLHELGYSVDHRIIDAQAWVPQHRERIFIVGFRESTAFTMDMVPIPKGPPPTLDCVLHREKKSKFERAEGEYTSGPKCTVNGKYTLTKHLWKYLQEYKKKHEAAGNGFGFGLVSRDDIARTLSARYYKDGSEILVSRGPGKNPRRLTPRECATLMGFPKHFRIPVSDTQAYKQFGNAVVVPVVEAIAKAMRRHVLALKAAEATPDQVSMPV